MEIINDYDTMCKCFKEQSECGIIFSRQQYVFFTQDENEERGHFGSWDKIRELITPGADANNSLSQGREGMIALSGDGFFSFYLPSKDKISVSQVEFLKYILKIMISHINPPPSENKIVGTRGYIDKSLEILLREIEEINPRDYNIDITEKIVGIPFKDLYPKNARNLFS